MAWSKSQQAMDSKWQIARKVDRIDLGSFAALEFYYRNAILFGIIRAMDPKEDETTDDGRKTIDQLIKSVDDRINELQTFDTTALMMGKMQLPEVQTFQKKTLSCWYENYEIIQRCKLVDNVMYQEREAP